MFDALMNEFQIFPRFKDFILLFGSKRGDYEMGLPRMRFRLLNSVAVKPIEQYYTGFGTRLSSAKRPSERERADKLLVECAYGLKYVESNNRNGQKPWSMRQTAVYHKYVYGQDVNTSTWMIVAVSKRTKRSVGKHVEGSADLTALNPFEIHVIILITSLANWRPYIIYLTEQITEQVRCAKFTMRSGEPNTVAKSDKLIVAPIDQKDSVYSLSIDERQVLKDLEDVLIDNLLVLESTADTINSLSRYYQRYCRANNNLSHDISMEDPDMIITTLQEQEKEVRLSKQKIETLHRKVQGSIELVRPYKGR